MSNAPTKFFERLDVDVTKLPPVGQYEGEVFEITIEASELCKAEYLSGATQSRKESTRERLDRLSTKLPERD